MASADDTIVAISTPLGESGLGVVRLSGGDAVHLADRIFRGASALGSVPTHTIHHGLIHDGDEPIDDAVASVYRAPRSYTGEDVIELSCHGSPAVLRRVVDLCVRQGARPAAPGEFTERAFVNGKMDLAQAEAVTALISAHSERARANALAQLRGALSTRVHALRSRLVDLLARIEAGLDFAEEDIPALSFPERADRLQALRDAIEDLLCTTAQGRLLRDGARIVIIGRPNAGKSSLFNALLGSDRAIVTDVPGTTRDVIEERVEWDGFPIVLVDTAGLRPARDAVEKIGVERARFASGEAALLLWVLDASAPPTADDEAILALAGGRPVVAVLNKIEISDRTACAALRRLLDRRFIVEASAATGVGLAAVRAAALETLGGGGGTPPEGAALTSARQIDLLRKAAGALDNALAAVRTRGSDEALALDIREALAAVSAITGDAVGEEVMDSVFRQFCIGK